MSDQSGTCPFTGGALPGTMVKGLTNAEWWSNQLNLRILHQHSPLSNPMSESFNYVEEFKTLDLNAVKEYIGTLMTDSRDGAGISFGLGRTRLGKYAGRRTR